MKTQLISTDASAGDFVKDAFHERHEDDDFSESYVAVFEHGQWWILQTMVPEADEEQRTYSVVDCETAGGDPYLGFEELG